MRLTAKSLLGTLMIATLFMASAIAHAYDRRDFWLANRTGKTIALLSVTPHGYQTSWYPITNSTTENGIKNPITFNPNFYSSSCFFDLRLQYSDGTMDIYDGGTDLCYPNTLRFYPGELVPSLEGQN